MAIQNQLRNEEEMKTTETVSQTQSNDSIQKDLSRSKIKRLIGVEVTNAGETGLAYRYYSLF